MYKKIKRNILNVKREKRNDKWGMRNEKCSISPKISQIDLWINKKRFFYWFVKLIYKKWTTTGLNLAKRKRKIF